MALHPELKPKEKGKKTGRAKEVHFNMEREEALALSPPLIFHVKPVIL